MFFLWSYISPSNQSLIHRHSPASAPVYLRLQFIVSVISRDSVYLTLKTTFVKRFMTRFGFHLMSTAVGFSRCMILAERPATIVGIFHAVLICDEMRNGFERRADENIAGTERIGFLWMMGSYRQGFETPDLKWERMKI